MYHWFGLVDEWYGWVTNRRIHVHFCWNFTFVMFKFGFILWHCCADGPVRFRHNTSGSVVQNTVANCRNFSSEKKHSFALTNVQTHPGSLPSKHLENISTLCPKVSVLLLPIHLENVLTFCRKMSSGFTLTDIETLSPPSPPPPRHDSQLI